MVKPGIRTILETHANKESCNAKADQSAAGTQKINTRYGT